MIHNVVQFNNQTMKKNYFLIKILVIYLFLNSVGTGKESDYFAKGMEHFKKNEFNKFLIIKIT